MISSEVLVDTLVAAGFDFYSGVPCSYLSPVLDQLVSADDVRYIGACQEGEALGLCIGASLAGRRSVALCQNSGLGNMVNAFTSVLAPLSVPVLLLTTLRGDPELQDEPQHQLMGKITGTLLDLLELSWRYLPEGEAAFKQEFAAINADMQSGSRAFAYVIRKGQLGTQANRATSAATPLMPPAPQKGVSAAAGKADYYAPGELTRSSAIDSIMQALPESTAVLASTGKTSRELFARADRPGNFYLVGGMGHASALAAGVALALPKQAVAVLDGDAAALMKLGNLATIGQQQISNLLHIILDNNSHDSTGGQITASHTTDFCAVASAVGYRHTLSANSASGISAALLHLQNLPGPNLLRISIKPGSPADLGRPDASPGQIKLRFMQFLREQAA